MSIKYKIIFYICGLLFSYVLIAAMWLTVPVYFDNVKKVLGLQEWF